LWLYEVCTTTEKANAAAAEVETTTRADRLMPPTADWTGSEV
jgi:hypothetical protein